MEPTNPAIALHNFNAVPRHIPDLLKTVNTSATELTAVAPLPKSPTAISILSYAREHLPTPTLHHSLRVFQYGVAIANDHFPSENLNLETYFVASLLHDIGTIPENISTALISFEFHGGIIAHGLLSAHDVKQADAVAEAIIRHQDIDDIGSGNITFLGALLQLATLYDNAGANDKLVADVTREFVVAEYPRLKWSSCFEAAITEECQRKPWSHTTKIGRDKFVGFIKGNTKGNAME
ncbi:hypothetical protein BP6252_06843 [Coleophoma cylindrospora]|uniref:HD domain-containing protein n=1 Tax=Coleophoma cylindrospora TaxID=1849047 RepID=A0A3D8RG43_9HELO|nr:hypothetical protein BP6252_06843 [Coleophoma cylindrospora]